MGNSLEDHVAIIKAAVEVEKVSDYSDILAIVDKFSQVLGVQENQKDLITNIILDGMTVSIDEDDQILTVDENRNWFETTRAERGQVWSDSYQDYLEKDMPPKVVHKIMQNMDHTMNQVGEPKQTGNFAKKGLVIGDVQSGKTGNFIALMNKAADAGYDMMIVTTGTIEKLRRQTQQRIEKGFYRSKEDPRRAFVTNIDKDFTKRTANAISLSPGFPVVAVIKKNVKSLRDLKEWLIENNGELINKSLLFIDDEADNASVNTRDENTPTAINNGIRSILNVFQRSSYVGFTGTPFANVLIDHTNEDDLFPKDFIQVLPTPTNYMGAQAIFGETSVEGETVEGEYRHTLKVIEDAADTFKPSILKDNPIEEMPESLVQAIRIFFLQNAIRDLRGEKQKHRSMLINVTHRIQRQRELTELVDYEVSRLKRQIRQYMNDNESEIYQSFETLYEDEFGEITETFEEISSTLYQSTDAIRVELVNASSKSFQYEDHPNGARVITVGGFALSRGLTLEGLSTSFLFRNTLMSDTLMQMARWFGYRPNYDDIVKIYMSEESIIWYEQVTNSLGDLKAQIQNMINAHQTPNDFGLYLMKPTTEALLLLTARAKAKAAVSKKVSMRLSGTVKENVRIQPSKIEENNSFVESFIERHLSNFDDDFLVKGVGKEVAEEILTGYQYSPFSEFSSAGGRTTVIGEMLNRFAKFDIKVISLAPPKKGETAKNGQITIQDRVVYPRQRLVRVHNEVIIFANSRIGSPTDGKFGVSETVVREALKATKKDKFTSEEEYFSCIDDTKRNPLILLYPMRIVASSEKTQPTDETKEFFKTRKGEDERLIWSLSIGIPESSSGEKDIAYEALVNTVGQHMEQMSLFDFYAEEEEDDIE